MGVARERRRGRRGRRRAPRRRSRGNLGAPAKDDAFGERGRAEHAPVPQPAPAAGGGDFGGGVGASGVRRGRGGVVDGQGDAGDGTVFLSKLKRGNVVSIERASETKVVSFPLSLSLFFSPRRVGQSWRREQLEPDGRRRVAQEGFEHGCCEKREKDWKRTFAL